MNEPNKMPYTGGNPNYDKYVGKHFYHNEYGEYYIKEISSIVFYKDSTKPYCIIHFNNTGYEYETRLKNAIDSKDIKDPYHPFVSGVGYFGEPLEYNNRMYYIWNDMIDRCYNPKCKDYHNYGAKGVIVSDRWKNFANFCEDFVNLPGYDKYIAAPEIERKNFHLDKDLLFDSTKNDFKVYGKDTCCIIKNTANVRESSYRKRIAHNSDYSSEYIGVHVKDNIISAVIQIDNKAYFLGSYDDEIAAANVYYYVAKCVDGDIAKTNAPYMEINEALSHCVSKKPIDFPPQVDTTNLVIPYKYHSCFYGVKKKRNNFYGLYHDGKNGSTHIGVFDDEIAAASAHNIYMRVVGDGYGHVNKESNEFHEMPLEEVMMHRCYTKQSEPKVMVADVNKDTNELNWYTKYTYKSKYLPISQDKGAFLLRMDIGNNHYCVGNYDSKEAAISMYNIINRYFNLCYDKNAITMTLEEALSHKTPNSLLEWPEGFDPNKWNIPLQLRVFNDNYNYTHDTRVIPYMNEYSYDVKRMYHLTNESEESRKDRCLKKYGIEFL